MKRRAFTVALTVLAQAQGAADPLLVIRQNYQAVNAAVAAGKFKASHKDFGDCGPARNSERTLWTDARGVPRKYVEAGGSDDSFVKLSAYLDGQGRVSSHRTQRYLGAKRHPAPVLRRRRASRPASGEFFMGAGVGKVGRA